MQQFDICINPNKATKAYAPYLLILQSDIIATRSTCVVAPLVKMETFTPAEKLNPVVTVEGGRFIVSTAELAGIDRRAIGDVIGTTGQQRDEII
ncbi:MAG: CcdB family protein [Methyloligellaceae bacterium]